MGFQIKDLQVMENLCVNKDDTSRILNPLSSHEKSAGDVRCIARDGGEGPSLGGEFSGLCCDGGDQARIWRRPDGRRV